MIEVIITDDHKIVRDGIKALLHDNRIVRIVGEASSGDELIGLLAHTQPDVVLMDVSMPGKDGFEMTSYVTEHYPEVKVLVLSMLANESYVHKMMEIGAAGYLLKTAGRDELCSALQLVASGNKYICFEVAIDLLQKVQAIASVPSIPSQSDDHRELSKRELEVLGLIGEGYTNAEIAEKLFTSKRTIETHRQNLLEKTKARNTATLIKYALQRGLIS